VNTLFRMCVLKHSSWMNPLALRPENALIRLDFSHYKKCFIPKAARSPHVYSARPGPRFRITSHYANSLSSRFLLAFCNSFARSIFSRMSFLKSCSDSVCCAIQSFCSLTLESIFSLRKTKNPRVFNPRVLLKFANVSLTLHRVLQGPRTRCAI